MTRRSSGHIYRAPTQQKPESACGPAWTGQRDPGGGRREVSRRRPGGQRFSHGLTLRRPISLKYAPVRLNLVINILCTSCWVRGNADTGTPAAARPFPTRTSWSAARGGQCPSRLFGSCQKKKRLAVSGKFLASLCFRTNIHMVYLSKDDYIYKKMTRTQSNIVVVTFISPMKI